MRGITHFVVTRSDMSSITQSANATSYPDVTNVSKADKDPDAKLKLSMNGMIIKQTDENEI